MPRPIHFEIPADNPERAIGFYKGVFGWNFQKWDGPMPYWMVLTGENTPGIDGGIHPRAHPGQGPVNTVDVPSCDDFAKRVEKAGLPRERVAPRFRDLPEDDFRTSSAHIVAVRR